VDILFHYSAKRDILYIFMLLQYFMGG